MLQRGFISLWDMLKESPKSLILCCWPPPENRKVKLSHEAELPRDRWGDKGVLKCRGDILNIYTTSAWHIKMYIWSLLTFKGKCIFFIIRYFSINMQIYAKSVFMGFSFYAWSIKEDITVNSGIQIKYLI